MNWSTLSDERAATSTANSRLYRAAMIVTGACNFACPYCNTLGGSRAPTLRKEKALSLVKDWVSLGLKELRLSGGEPTIVPWLHEIVSLASGFGVRVAVSTNGYSDLSVYEKLIDAGVSEFSVSLDSSDPEIADEQSGNSTGVLERVVASITYMSSRNIPVYIGLTCGREKTAQEISSTIALAEKCGVSEIKIMSLSQEGEIVDTSWMTEDLQEKYSLLKWRSSNFRKGRDVRGLKEGDCGKCHIVLDDATIAGKWHYPCNVYFREKGAPIGEVGESMLAERASWHERHDSLSDPICSSYCMDILREYNNRADELKTGCPRREE